MILSSKKSPGWISVVLFCITLCSCAGSKSMVVPLNLTSQTSDSINIMPFNTTFERKYYSDVHLRGKALLEILIVQEINRRSGLYTYTFDDNDLKNLKTSLIDSLKATNHFRAVHEILSTDETMPDHGKRLYIDFESMGVSQKIRFICEIKARAMITDSAKKVLVEKNIYISEKGTMTLSAAKNKAIEEFILEISRLLNAM